jgi:threonine dehydrogenase-like Zn-dependent dehydrogenase
MRRARVEYGDRVLVLGFGVVGLLSSLHARRAGVDRVFIADPLHRKRELAAQKGFGAPLDPLHEDFEKEVLDRTEGMGFDVVIEASGHPSSIDPAFRAVRLGGRILIQGTHTAPVPIVFSDYVMHKEITIIGTWKGGTDLPSDPQHVRWNGRLNTHLSMRLIEAGQLPVQNSITHRIPFEELPDLYSKIEKRELEFLQIILEY